MEYDADRSNVLELSFSFGFRFVCFAFDKWGLAADDAIADHRQCLLIIFCARLPTILRIFVCDTCVEPFFGPIPAEGLGSLLLIRSRDSKFLLGLLCEGSPRVICAATNKMCRPVFYGSVVFSDVLLPRTRLFPFPFAPLLNRNSAVFGPGRYDNNQVMIGCTLHKVVGDKAQLYVKMQSHNQ